MLAERIAEEIAKYTKGTKKHPKCVFISKEDLDSLGAERPDFVSAASIWGLSIKLVPAGSLISVGN